MAKGALSRFLLQPADPTNRPSPAGLPRRALAFLIDVSLVGVVVTIAGVRWGTATGQTQWQLNGLPACGVMIFMPAYWLVSEALWRATPGKFFLDLRVLSLRSGDLEFQQVVRRDIVKLLDFPTFGLVSFGVALSNPLRQSLGDLWAKTMVVDATRYAKWRAGSSSQDFKTWLTSFDKTTSGAPGKASEPPNTALQRTRSAPLRSPLSFQTLGDPK